MNYVPIRVPEESPQSQHFSAGDFFFFFPNTFNGVFWQDTESSVELG